MTRQEVFCLTPEEVASLRALLASLSVMEGRLLRHHDRVLEITDAAWQEMVIRPADGLRRVHYTARLGEAKQ